MSPICRYICYIPDIATNTDTHVSLYIEIQNEYQIIEMKSDNNEFFVIIDDNVDDNEPLDPNSIDTNKKTKTYIRRLFHNDPGDYINVEINHDYDHHHTHGVINPQLITTHKVTHRVEDPRGN